MKLKAIVENLDDIPEAFREYYREVDGKYVLDLDADIRSHPDVAALKNALERTKTENAALKTQNGELKAKADQLPEGFTVEEWDRLKALDDGSDPNDPEKNKNRDAVQRVREQYEQRISAANTKHANEIRAKDEIIAARDGQIEKLIIDTALDAAMDSATIDPKYRKAVRALLRSDIKVVNDNGELSAVADDTPLDQYVSTWSQSDEGRVYVNQARGSDAGNPGGPGKGGNDGLPPGASNPWDPKTLNLTEQGRILRTNRDLARRLAAKHGTKISEGAA